METRASSKQPHYADEMERFLISHHAQQLCSVVLSPDPKLHYPLHIDFAELMDEYPPLANFVYSQPAEYLRHFDQAAVRAQKSVLKVLHADEKGIEKKFIHVRVNVSGSPLECPETFPRIGHVRVRHRGILLTLKGTVIRSAAVKMYEGERMYRCRKCKHGFSVYPELESRNSIALPSFCPSERSKPCEGTRFDCIDGTILCHDYQEIKIQESTQVLGVGVIPRSVPVILMDDLVDIVKAGDDVIVTGILTAKWSPELKDVRSNLEPVLIANHVRRTNELKSDVDIPNDIMITFNQFWSDFKDCPLKGRNTILQGVCPQVFGLFIVKLAVALTLIGGVQHVDASGTKIRGESHLLLVGDPGTGKSQFLKFAAKLSNRSVITTGLGSTSAGLTVTAVKDGGEWMLEAGALVLADGGLCCIDEFDSMREHDRATIHEAMEQQTISIAKAGLVTTLSTKTVVFGATNPKGHSAETQKSDSKDEQTLKTRVLSPSYHQFALHRHFISDLASAYCNHRDSHVLIMAGLVTTLSTKTVVFGATNPKGQYDPEQSLSVNTTLSGPLLSRFDIVLVLLDTKNPEWDAVVSSHILAEEKSITSNNQEGSASIWTVAMLRRYIQFVKGYFRPVLTKEAEKVISNYFQLQRQSATDNAARTTIRMLESLIRLAQAHARLMFRNEVTQLDAIMAILCMESSMTTSAIVDSVGNAVHSNFTENPDEEYTKQEKLILEKLRLMDDPFQA